MEEVQMRRNQLASNMSEPPGECIHLSQSSLQMTAAPVNIRLHAYEKPELDLSNWVSHKILPHRSCNIMNWYCCFKPLSYRVMNYASMKQMHLQKIELGWSWCHSVKETAFKLLSPLRDGLGYILWVFSEGLECTDDSFIYLFIHPLVHQIFIKRPLDSAITNE